MPRIRSLLVLLAAGALLAAPLAHGATSGVVISQIFAGGGNAGASYTNDFVELFNRGASAIDLTGWTIQYASAASTTWQTTALVGSIGPGRYYLVQLAS
ncbi:MAG TPA: lamin tail domain-containing protein, partial [Ktedonobacterales bacterium]|nr:lamin tail domain-containing protein [Ktedonobacterales bacterium]